MKTSMACVAVLLLVGCGSESGDHQSGAPIVSSDVADATITAQASCAPVDPCETDGPRFCTVPNGGCYLLYPNQRTVPVTCLAALNLPTRSGRPVLCP